MNILIFFFLPMLNVLIKIGTVNLRILKFMLRITNRFQFLTKFFFKTLNKEQNIFKYENCDSSITEMTLLGNTLKHFMKERY